MLKEIQFALVASLVLLRPPLDTLNVLRVLPGLFRPDTKRPSANLVGLEITPVLLALRFV